MYPVVLKENQLFLSGISLTQIAEKYGTPTYVYSLDVAGKKYDDLFNYITWPHLKIFYAMKSNSNLELLKFFQKKGSGIDAVSYGDILLALEAGFSPDKIIYTANNITNEEMSFAQKTGVLMNIGELSRLEKFGATYPGSEICIRINPEVVGGENEKVQTGHGALSKFGILMENMDQVKAITKKYNLTVIGIHEHTGSGIADFEAIYQAMKNTLNAAEKFDTLKFIDFGGGFKVPYKPEENRINYSEFGAKVSQIFSDFCAEYGRELDMYFEPGKYLSAEMGIFLVEVNTLRDNRGRLFAGVNSGFSQLIRPVIYEAYHHIMNCSHPNGKGKKYDIVGNICEGGDLFAKERIIPEIQENDILAIQNAGSYCFSMASIYNNRPLPAEVVIEKGIDRLARPRESYKSIIQNHKQ